MHVAFNAVLTGVKSGNYLTDEEASEIAINDYEKSTDNIDITYTSSIKDKDKAIKKIKMMAPSLIKISKEIEVEAIDVFSERKFNFHDISITFKGTADVITTDNYIIDLKTGVSKSKTSWLQYCGYNFLFKPKREISGLREYFVSSTKPENNLTKEYSSDDAMPYFKEALTAILEKTNTFYESKKIESFKANPASILCSKKYCTAYDTEACPISKFISMNLE